MNVQAKAKYIHMSPRKTRLIVDLIRGLPIEDARRQLKFSSKAASVPVLKVLNSAIANAENNFKLDTTDFSVLSAQVSEGPTIFRYRPRAQGRATPIRKRMSHITVVVGSKNEDAKEEVAVKEEKAEKKLAAKKVEKKKAAPKTKKEVSKPEEIKS